MTKRCRQGLPTRKERIDYLLKEDIWTEEKIRKIIKPKAFSWDFKKLKKRFFFRVHIDQINNEIKKIKDKIGPTGGGEGRANRFHC